MYIAGTEQRKRKNGKGTTERRERVERVDDDFLEAEAIKIDPESRVVRGRDLGPISGGEFDVQPAGREASGRPGRALGSPTGGARFRDLTPLPTWLQKSQM